VLSNLQKEKPTYGTIVGGGNTSHTTELETLYKLRIDTMNRQALANQS